jgi:HD-GYP domain-containing protein (c-di-GMP phosphodiesterase class II)
MTAFHFLSDRSFFMKNEIKTSIDGLEVGMYVSRLDRPWIKTPFELKGLNIKSAADIERIRKYCNYVYVDVERGSSPEPCFWVLRQAQRNNSYLQKDPSRTKSANTHSASDEFTRVRKRNYTTSSKFEPELETAKEIYRGINDDLTQVMPWLKLGRDLDIETIKQGISIMTESIIRNPAAMMWVISLRKVDDHTYSRSLGTSVWCVTFGRHLGLEKSSLEALALGGLLLDIGKSKLSKKLLQKKGPLTPEEKQQMDIHVDLGVKILADSQNAHPGEKIPNEVLKMIATHHERADGSGYPQCLVNNEIPLFGRIAGIVDSYDAMTSSCPYMKRDPLTPHEAIAELYELRDRSFQTELIEQFIQAVGLYPTGTLVELSTGEVGAVVAVNGLKRLRPSIIVLLDENKEPLSEFVSMDLSQASEDITVARGLTSGAYGINMSELFL